MKQLATIGIVVLVLIGSAFYFKTSNDTEEVRVSVETPKTQPERPKLQPTTRDVSRETLTFSSTASSGYVPLSHSKTFYVELDVTADTKTASVRPPLDLVVVIDKSGSMKGDKMNNARSAAQNLVNKLGEKDRFALVSYSNYATTDVSLRHVTPIQRSSINSAIQRIRPKGSTNISDGLQTAWRQLLNNRSSTRMQRVILLSDGRPTVGMKSQSQLENIAKVSQQSNVSVSTIGVGLDYNENLMTGIAKHGTGNYYFVDSPGQIHTHLQTEFSKLDNVIARDIVLDVQVGQDFNVSTVRGFAYERNGQNLTIKMPNISRNESKNVLLELVGRGNGDVQKATEMIQASITYKDSVKGKASAQKVGLVGVTSNDAQELENVDNVDVVGRLQQVEYADEVAAAMDYWSKGDKKEAKRRISATRKRMKKRNKTFKFKDAKKYDFADDKLGDLEKSLDAPAAADSAPAKRAQKKAKAESFEILQDATKF